MESGFFKKQPAILQERFVLNVFYTNVVITTNFCFVFKQKTIFVIQRLLW